MRQYRLETTRSPRYPYEILEDGEVIALFRDHRHARLALDALITAAFVKGEQQP